MTNDVQGSALIQDFDVVPCTTLHEGELFAVFERDSIEPGTGREHCEGEAFEDFVGIAHDASDLFVQTIDHPGEDGDGVVLCFAAQFGADLTESVEASRR